jgi:hypothetical protein
MYPLTGGIIVLLSCDQTLPLLPVALRRPYT